MDAFKCFIESSSRERLSSAPAMVDRGSWHREGQTDNSEKTALKSSDIMAPETPHPRDDKLALPVLTSDGPEIRTYKMLERSERLDFEIRSHTVRPPVTTPHRHEFFQIEANLSGEAHHVICGRRCIYPARSLIFILPYRVHYATHEIGNPDYYVINFTSNFLKQDFNLSPLEIEAASIVEHPELIPFLYEGSC